MSSSSVTILWSIPGSKIMYNIPFFTLSTKKLRADVLSQYCIVFHYLSVTFYQGHNRIHIKTMTNSKPNFIFSCTPGSQSVSSSQKKNAITTSINTVNRFSTPANILSYIISKYETPQQH